MVKTDNVEEVGVNICGVDRYLDGIDINNSCRRVYLRRMESIEECKRSSSTDDAEKQSTSIGAALARLRTEMVGLMDQDAGLMRQMLILNEKVEELKANNICQMSKESLDSYDSLYLMEGQTANHLLESKDSLYHTDEQSDDLSSDEETFQCSDSAYSDSDEDKCNIISQSRDCLTSRKESESLDSVFDSLLEFDTM
ncbi:uncharacterized protein LOC110466581 [Mizuhopecten yessoensis]|uniref:Uncharacterized protein n=1 Tax=Mizuhopecten yessoensis TaxID=6573 RepID=A0A210PNS1_MIZYE|nr:uncharacterized protein LOC110466581 [Mizuhopecten yessoensis]OWF38131.1 hypothetical protein KP79_PYT08841 [Mizuhopecten yessoensis]